MKDDEQGEIQIAIAFDKNYYKPFMALCASACSNNKNGQLHFHLIASGISDSEKRAIEQLIKRFSNFVSFHSIKDDSTHGLVLLHGWTNAVYYRLFFPLILSKSLKRIIYFDSDTLVLNNLEPLWNMETGNFPVGAVYDNFVKTQPLLSIHEEGQYFNSGVLLINLNVWRQQKISEKTLQFLKENPEKIKYVDQCGLNAVLRHNWAALDSRFNCLYSYLPQQVSRRQIKKVAANLLVLHFTLHRPWNMLNKNRLSYLYFKYLKLSGLATYPRYTDFSLSKIPQFLGIRMQYLYFDLPLLAFVWRKLKIFFTR